MRNKNRRKLLAKAWYDFFVLEIDDVSNVDDFILESWRRSRSYKIDYEKQGIEESDKEARERSIEENNLLIEIARPYMDDLYKIINNTNFMITLLDEDGILLEAIVHPNLQARTKFHSINLSERRVGTNAMGTCLILNRPIQTYGEEHFHKLLQQFTTSAAPIHDESGELLGCIGITGFANDVSVHTLGMATAVSYAIENKIRLSKDKHNSYNESYFHIIADKRIREGLYSFDDIIGESNIIKESINIAKIAARGNSNVLILGESGTGKELFAQSIHNSSNRRDKPFIDINCGALPEGLAESELFGYEGGAYTGSRKEGQPGKFELAHGGTIFLDEIGELPLSIQASLLRVIQERRIVKVGGSKSKDIDIMIIAATNRNLFEAVKNGGFRKDLFYRLNVFTINLPSLREHREDIQVLIDFFIKRYNRKFNRRIQGITTEVLYIFHNYNWPGNIRELENVIERGVQIAQRDRIDIGDLPVYLTEDINIANIKGKESITVMESEECKIIHHNLDKTKGNIKLTSEILGISRATLYRKISRYNLDIDNYRYKS